MSSIYSPTAYLPITSWCSLSGQTHAASSSTRSASAKHRANRSLKTLPARTTERTGSFRRQLVTGRLLIVPHQQHPPCQGRVVPGFLRQRRNRAQLDELPGVGPYQKDAPRLGLNDQEVAGQQHLSVLVAPALPQPLSGLEINAGQNAVVQAV